MLKLTAIVSLMLIATWSQADSKKHKRDATSSEDFETGSTLWAASLSCDSCGSECAAACGTRHFRSCCFNYLRRKRGQENVKFWPQTLPDPKEYQPERLPYFMVKTLPESWLTSNDFKLYPQEDTIDNRVSVQYDA